VLNRLEGQVRTRFERSPLQRKLLLWVHRLGGLASPIAPWLLRQRPKMWVFPHLPYSWTPRLKSPAKPWPKLDFDVPQSLRTSPGIAKLPEAEESAFNDEPLHDFFTLHGQKIRPPLDAMWMASLSTSPRIQKGVRARLMLLERKRPAPESLELAPEEFTRQLKLFAAEIGLSAIGITHYDKKYQFAEYAGRQVGETIIVGLQEQNFESTQIVPSVRSERAALSTYGELEQRMTKLGHWVMDRGYDARPEGYVGESVNIAYAVEAGLGQLGLNGQLLTPAAGSRVRLHVMSTNAPLAHDKPVDYGIEGVCNECKICVRRCPVGAIPAQRKECRGVVKAKLNTKRCLPIVGQAAGCSVCMKTCPIQRFGLDAVLAEYRRSGQILGKDTDDLEGYDWPLDGKHYGPTETPKVAPYVLNPPGFEFDPKRRVPVGQVSANDDPTGY
jgi:epoxyqueuosine reductase